jgi:hypothetical protein
MLSHLGPRKLGSYNRKTAIRHSALSAVRVN